MRRSARCGNRGKSRSIPHRRNAHHDAIKAAAAGITVVCTLHSNSERATLKRLQQRLTAAFPELPVLLSQVDRDPFSVR